MRIYEMFETPGFSTEAEDDTVLKLSDMRKTSLTLAQINRLRIMHDVRKFELSKKSEIVSKQYSSPAAEQPMM